MVSIGEGQTDSTFCAEQTSSWLNLRFLIIIPSGKGKQGEKGDWRLISGITVTIYHEIIATIN